MVEIKSESTYERLFAIGDLHGCHAPFAELIQKISPGENDLVVFVGDYIDRGPESKRIVEDLIRLRSGTASFCFLKGNHEDMLLGAAGYPAVVGDLETWLYNGGTSTLESYGLGSNDIYRILYIKDRVEREAAIRNTIPQSHLDFYLSLELYLETEHFFFCHAGVDSSSSIEEGKRNHENLLWIRSHLNVNNVRWEKTVVCGHTPLYEPIVRNKLICIDTGLYYYGTLTAIDVLNKTIVQVRR